MAWQEDIEIYLRWFYYISSIGLVTSLIIGIRQLRTLREDIHTRSQRASFEKTIEYMEWYSEFIVTCSKFHDKFNEVKEQFKSDLPPESTGSVLDEINYSYEKSVSPDDQFNIVEFSDPKELLRVHILRFSGVVHLLNQLEIFAAVMNCRIADEEMAFTPLSDNYCQIVVNFYHVLCEERNNNSKLYSNIVGLFSTWQGRILKNNIQKEIDSKQSILSQISDIRKPPLGVNMK